MYLSVTTQGEVLAKLERLPEHLQLLLREKMEALVDTAYAKVQENLSGKVLQEKSGMLKASVRHGVQQQGSLLIGYIELDPEPPYAKVQEFGGKGSYLITPSKANLLSFYWELLGKRVALRYVNHPPLPARPYITPVLAELAAKSDAEFQSAINSAIIL